MEYPQLLISYKKADQDEEMLSVLVDFCYNSVKATEESFVIYHFLARSATSVHVSKSPSNKCL
jgi:hypothetical protein